MTVLGGLQYRAEIHRDSKEIRFNTDDGIRRAAIKEKNHEKER